MSFASDYRQSGANQFILVIVVVVVVVLAVVAVVAVVAVILAGEQQDPICKDETGQTKPGPRRTGGV
jgi:flagellar basal body-associated protein FliL